MIKPGYKKTEIGWIPDEWYLKRICEIGTVVTGFTPPRNNESNWGGLIPWATAQDFKSKYIKKTKESISTVGTINKRIVPKGSILITCIASIGLNAITTCDTTFNQQINAIIVFDYIENEFIYYILSYKKDALIKLAGSTAVPIINKTEFEKFKLPLPPLPEQKKISEILSIWDKAIETTENLIEAKTKLKQWLMQKLLTGKMRFKEFIKNNELIKTKNGRVPKDWQFLKASEIFKRHNQNCMGNLELLSVTQDRGVIPRSMLEARVTMPSGNTESFKYVSKGDFVISLRAFEGGIEYSEYEGLVSPAYTIIKPILPIDNGYFKFYFKSKDFISKLAIAVIGIRDGKQISWEDFGIIRLFYPSVNEQKKIANILSKLEAEIGMLNIKLKALKEQKKGLMQKLLTGEVRVKV